MRNQDNQDKIENNEWMICKKKKKRSAINQNESGGHMNSPRQ